MLVLLGPLVRSIDTVRIGKGIPKEHVLRQVDAMCKDEPLIHWRQSADG